MSDQTLAKKMTERAVGGLFQNDFEGKLALFAATVERHKHDMMRTNQPYENVINPHGEDDVWEYLPGQKEIDFIWYLEDYRRFFNDYETYNDDRFLIHIYDRFFEIVEEKWKEASNLNGFVKSLNEAIINPNVMSSVWRNMSELDQMKYVGLEGYPNKKDEPSSKRRQTAHMALCYMNWIRNYFVADIQTPRMRFEKADPKNFDVYVNAIHQRNGRVDILTEKDEASRPDFYLTQKPS